MTFVPGSPKLPFVTAWAGLRPATQGQGEARLYVVRVGWFRDEAEARRAGEEAGRTLGVAYRLVRNP